MAKKLSGWKTKGMNRDLSVSAFNPEFAFENMNLRLATNENNTLLSWVNERGTAPITLVYENWIDDDIDTPTCVTSITGTPIGTAILNHQLVLFTHGTSDNIYVIRYKDSSVPSMKAMVLYSGNLNFDVNFPLETLVSYESETVQKVYWVDGKNQPRLVNIADYNNVAGRDPSYFDFVNELALREEIWVKKLLGASGMFAPGVIQYAFTYYNKNGQETNIFYTTPLNYISNFDRGVSPEGKVENAFQISIKGVDGRFDYLRIYSIQRTSINGTPICKRIQDIAVKDLNINAVVSYTDTGLNGNTVDPTELLYKGGEAIIASTLEQKDGTLFLGNICLTMEHKPEGISQTTKKTNWPITDSTRTFTATRVSDGIYDYSNQLTSYQYNPSDPTEANISVPCAGFKRGDIYRCGVQFQHKTGKWSDPVWINDILVTNKPTVGTDASVTTVPTLTGTIPDATVITNLYNKGYRRARAVVVFPNMLDRNIVCQGVANPTMYTINHRGDPQNPSSYDKDMYAQSSWFFRPQKNANIASVSGQGAVFPTDSGVLNYANREIDGIDAYNPEDNDNNKQAIRKVEIQGDFKAENKFRVDKTEVLTLNSPDLEFDDHLQVMDFSNVGYKKVGDVQFTGTLSDINIQTETPVISNTGAGFIHKSFSDTYNRGIVSGLFYEDWIVDDMGTGAAAGAFSHFERYNKDYENSPLKWMVYLWNKDGSLNNDVNRPSDQGTQTAILKKKVISNLRFTKTTLSNSVPSTTSSFDFIPQLFNSDDNTIIKVGNAIYKGNIDTVLVPDRADGMYFAFGDWGLISSNLKASNIDTSFTSNCWWKLFSVDPSNDTNGYGIYEHVNTGYTLNWSWYNPNGYKVGRYYLDLVSKKDPVRMKYKSTPHLVIRKGNGYSFPSTLWSDMSLPILEITRQNNTNPFGGESADALQENIWIPCGEPVTLWDYTNNILKTNISFDYSYGDTYFQRYDCLKTYAFTPEDTNQVVEIGSFMLETHVNIDGRYDRNRGQINNLNMSPRNFNLINPVYSQTDNFFTYKIMPENAYRDTVFPNQITWTKTKESGADVDQWTNITLASVLELDGDKGKLNNLTRLNDQVLAFQDTGISQILYNENVQISSTDGVPIEIANSGKVQGKRYLSNTIGCSNKWSMTTTPAGIYFMDSHDKSIYLFNGQLQNLSNLGGFATWTKNNVFLTGKQWDSNFTTTDFITQYDKLNQDVLFINRDIALAWSERLQAFTSFYSYGHTPFLCNLDDTGIWIRNDASDSSLWKHQAGNYCSFFGDSKPYWMTLVGNPEPQLDKIFTNIEFRACVDGEGRGAGSGTQGFSTFDYTFDYTFHNGGGGGGGSYKPYLPFDYLEAWNEYQSGRAELKNKDGHSYFMHHTPDGEASLKRKFRIWRCDIPRDNCRNGSVFQDTFSNVFRGHTRNPHPTDRMRNPWLYIKLGKKAEESNHRTEIHDIVMTYFG